MAKSTGRKTVEKKSLRDYLTVVFRRVWLFVVPMVVGTSLVVTVVLAMPPKYRATALARRVDQVALSASMHGVDVASGRAALAVIKEEILAYSQLVELLKREDVARAEGVNLQEMSVLDQQETLDRLRKKISITSVTQKLGTEIVGIMVTDTNPERAKVLANAIGLSYAEYHRKVLEEQAKVAMEFQQKQLTECKTELEKVEKELERYRMENFDQLPGVKTDVLNRRLELNREIPLAQRRLDEAKQALEDHRTKLKESPQRVTRKVSPTEGPEAVQLRQRISDLEKSLANMLLTLTPNHPDVRLVRQEIESGKTRLTDLAKDSVREEEVEMENPLYRQMVEEERRLEADVQAHTSSVNFLQTERDELGKVIQTYAPDAWRYNEMLRRENEWTRKYAMRKEMADNSEVNLRRELEGKATKVELFDPAWRGRLVFPPPIYVVALMALAAGMGVGAGFVVLGEISDSSFRTVEDASDYLEVPILGTVGTIEPTMSGVRVWVKRVVLGLLVVTMLAGSVAAYLYREELRSLMSRYIQ